jgi:hypothetical protein
MAYFVFDQINDKLLFLKGNEGNFMSTLAPKNGDFHSG